MPFATLSYNCADSSKRRERNMQFYTFETKKINHGYRTTHIRRSNTSSTTTTTTATTTTIVFDSLFVSVRVHMVAMKWHTWRIIWHLGYSVLSKGFSFIASCLFDATAFAIMPILWPSYLNNRISYPGGGMFVLKRVPIEFLSKWHRVLGVNK